MIPNMNGAETTISILRYSEDETADGWPDVEPTWSAVVGGIRAVIASPGGTTLRDGSVQTVLGFRMAADPCDLRHTDRVLDEGDQTVYQVQWVKQAKGFGLDHVSCELRTVEGVV